MSVFASAGQKSKQKFEHKIERVKGLLEHLSLYVGLAIYTALGAKGSHLAFSITSFLVYVNFTQLYVLDNININGLVNLTNMYK